MKCKIICLRLLIAGLVALSTLTISGCIEEEKPSVESDAVAPITETEERTPTLPPPPPPTPPPAPTPPQPPPPKLAAEFEVSSLVVKPKQILAGEPVAVEVNVINTGDNDGTYKASLKIDREEVETKDITLAVGASGTVSFEVTRSTPLTYTVYLDGLTGTFTVLPSAETLFQEGQELLQEKEYEDAISKYGQVTDDFPDSSYAAKAKEAIPECYYRWGLQLRANREHSEAMEKFSLILDEYPGSPCASNIRRVTEEAPDMVEIIYCRPTGFNSAQYKVRNKSEQHFIEATIKFRLLLKGKSVFSMQIRVGALEPGEEAAYMESFPKVYSPGPGPRVIYYDDYDSTVTEVWYRGELPLGTTELFFDSFEHGLLANWEESSREGWSCSGIGMGAAEGKSYVTIPLLNRAEGVPLTQKDGVDLSAMSAATLTFFWGFSTAPWSGDYIALDLWNGETWNEVAQLKGEDTESGTWYYEVLDLNDCLIKDFKIRFRDEPPSSRFGDATIDAVKILGYD